MSGGQGEPTAHDDGRALLEDRARGKLDWVRRYIEDERPEDFAPTVHVEYADRVAVHALLGHGDVDQVELFRSFGRRVGRRWRLPTLVLVQYEGVDDVIVVCGHHALGAQLAAHLPITRVGRQIEVTGTASVSFVPRNGERSPAKAFFDGALAKAARPWWRKLMP